MVASFSTSILNECRSCNAYRLCLLVCSCTISDHQRLQFEFFDHKHAYNQCCFSAWWHCTELPAVPLVSNWIFLSVDSCLCHFPVGCPCLHCNLVAIPIPWFIFSIFSFMVFIGGADAHTMLWHFCSGNQAQTPFAIQMVSSVLSVCKMRWRMHVRWSSLINAQQRASFCQIEFAGEKRIPSLSILFGGKQHYYCYFVLWDLHRDRGEEYDSLIKETEM